MTVQFVPKPRKTYATEAGAKAAVEKLFGKTSFRYMVVCTAEGRFYPIFIGQEAMQVIFHGFTVVG